MEYLYRGQSLSGHKINDGIINAKGTTFTRTMRIGEPMARIGNGCRIGETEANAVISHQQDSSSYPTAGISTTPFYERAVIYATSNGRVDGVVYKISRNLLLKYNVREFVVSDYMTRPKIPEDHEVILVPPGYSLPPETIVDVIPVNLQMSG